MADQELENTFELENFLPYRLSVLTNTISQGIAAAYRDRYGISVTEWRILAVLGRFPGLTASEVVEKTAMDKVTRRIMEHADRLKIIAIRSAGFEGTDLEAATDHGIVVTHNPGSNSDPVADMAIGLMLMITWNPASKNSWLPRICNAPPRKPQSIGSPAQSTSAGTSAITPSCPSSMPRLNPRSASGISSVGRPASNRRCPAAAATTPTTTVSMTY